jgi:hypothetical protein
MSAEDKIRPSDRAFSHPGTGMASYFRCAGCDNKSSLRGSGMAHIQGLRQKVCATCKDRFNKARMADQ